MFIPAVDTFCAYPSCMKLQYIVSDHHRASHDGGSQCQIPFSFDKAHGISAQVGLAFVVSKMKDEALNGILSI